MESPRHTPGMLKLKIILNRPESPYFESYYNSCSFSPMISELY